MSNLNWAKLRDQCLVAVAAVFFVYALWWVVSHFLIHAAVLVLLAIVVAAALEPILSRLEKFMPRLVAALATYLVEDTLSTVLGGYIRGQLTMALIIGVSAGVGSWLLGVQYPIVIGVLAFLFELVPMVGPILAALPAVLISAFQPFPLMLEVVGFFIAIQFVENNILAPRISAGAVGLHPIAAILGLVAGFEAAGVVGALFALPALSAASVIGSAALKSWRGEPVVVKRGEMTFRMPIFRKPKPKTISNTP